MTPAKRFWVHHRPDQPIGDTVETAITGARAFADGCGLEPAACARLFVVVDELVGNLLRHGRPGCDVRVNIVLSQADDPGEVIMVLEDDCLPFDPRNAGFDGPDGESGGGVGLALVKAFADIAGYESERGINRLTLRLKRAGAE